jgi:hypothetical protein
LICVQIAPFTGLYTPGMHASRTPFAQLRRQAALLLCLVCALTLFKAATPWLAAWSAQQQGVAMAEVCSVYGVRTVAVDAAPTTPAEHAPSSDHANEHCALAAVVAAAVSTPALSAVALHAPAAQALALNEADQLVPPDATRHWVAALKHGPPPRA